METTMTIQAIFTETVQLSQLTVTVFLVVMMVLCYLLGNYHGQLEVLKEIAPKKFKPTKEMLPAEMPKEKDMNMLAMKMPQEKAPQEKYTGTEEKGEREREEDIDADMRRLLLEANANI